MFPYPTPTLDFDIQSQPQDNFHNKKVANNPWAVQQGPSAINTNVVFINPGGYPSESPLPMSSSTNGHSNYDLGLLNPSNVSTQTSDSEEWSSFDTGTSSQALVPRSRKEANEALINKFRAYIWLFLKSRLRVRTLRRKSGKPKGGTQRYSASSCPSRTAGSYNVSQQVPPPGFSFSSDDAAWYGLPIGDQVNPSSSLDLPGSAWWGDSDNPLGIFSNDEDLPFLVPTNTSRQVTDLSEEEITPTTAQEPVTCLNGPPLSEIEIDQFGQGASTSSRSGKRPIDCIDPEDSPIDETSQRSNKRNRSKKTPTSPRLACPFYQHDQERYRSTRSCCGPGWESVHRVKEHIFRRHVLPENQCPRCFETFDTGEVLFEHSRAGVRCEVRSQNPQEGINQSQWKQLHARAKKASRRSHPRKVEEERWKEVYRIIFPGEEVPSPYYNQLQEPSNDNFERKILADFDQRILFKLEPMNMQTLFPAEVAKIACSALRETIQSCRQANEDSGCQDSQLTTSRPQDTQTSPGVGSPLTTINANFGDYIDAVIGYGFNFNDMDFGRLS
ncbi:hypothetical protein NW762_006950 [Fusarium torreyae]|uniref:C2H2-type domain-containing protein n=1 Tax=Fusarium torreyae TaxID=1237075 RepID=A0A9W8S0S5_9HYPO|nr:hypothetical protein NW762_006950 [Fusarium torreyae]